MRRPRTPRRRIRGSLTLIAIVAVILALVRPTPRGSLLISRLRHAGGGDAAPQAVHEQAR